LPFEEKEEEVDGISSKISLVDKEGEKLDSVSCAIVLTEKDGGQDGISCGIMLMGENGEELDGISCTTLDENEFEGLGFSISRFLVKNFVTDGNNLVFLSSSALRFLLLAPLSNLFFESFILNKILKFKLYTKNITILYLKQYIFFLYLLI